MSDLSKKLCKVLSSDYAFSLKVQNFHWNIESKNFLSLHEFFGDIYKDFSSSIDVLAEIIRQFGEKIPANFEYFSVNSIIASAHNNLADTDMIVDLIEDMKNLIDLYNSALKFSQEKGDEVVADYFIQRMSSLRKYIWMLRSTADLPKDINL